MFVLLNRFDIKNMYLVKEIEPDFSILYALVKDVPNDGLQWLGTLNED